jgi:CDP-glycerol glycerophosphotransferase (TagB/SpsB family)
MITNNEMELRELEKSGLKSCKFNSLYSYILASKAKNIISEQVILEYFKDISTSQKTLQLWHGVPFKKLNSVNNIEYDYFVATSDYLNKEIFSFLFKSKKYINCGYPRIDAFSDEDNLLFCDKNIYELVKNNKKNGIKTIIYVPTYRDDVESNISPIDFFKLDNFLVENNICFIVKFHHFVLEQFDIKIDDSKKYNNIVFYNSQGDIYPIIKYVDLLITDYSSIAFDYLLLNRPIIYFDYDIEEYKQSRGEFLLDYDKYTPGIKVKNQIELEKAILTTLEKDAFFNQRKELVKELFDYVDHNVSNRIFNELQIKER